MIELKICPVCNTNKFEAYQQTKDYTVSGKTFALKRCTSCSLVATTPRPTDQDLNYYYQSDNYISHANKSKSPLDVIYSIARTFTLKWKEGIVRKQTNELKILDYGCGTGNFLAHCQKKGWQIAGLEPNENAKKIATATTGKIIFTNIAEIAGTYPIITLWHVLEHIPDINGVLTTLKNHLDSTGRIFVAVPNLSSWESKHYGEYWAAFDTPRHLWHFNKNSFTKLANKNNLRVIDTIPMKLDAYYVSLLSEKYRSHGNHTFSGMIHATLTAMKSNRKAKINGEYSSQIYVLEHA